MRRHEQGSALLAVLVLIFTAGILTGLMLSISKIGTFETATHVQRQRSMYIAEGAAQRIQWLIMIDRYLHSSETLGETDYEEYDYDRYLADGIRHTIDYYGEAVDFTISDTNQGTAMNGNNYRNGLNRLKVGRTDDQEYIDVIDQMIPKISDYIDSDDDIQTDGLEESDYEEMGLTPLPRNGALQYREELLWIPGFRELFPVDKNGLLSSVRLIPPENTVTLSGNPALLTATRQELQSYCNLEDEEIDQVVAVIEAWTNEKVKISDSDLDPLISGRLNSLSRRESGNYTVLIEAGKEQPRPFRKLIFSFQSSGISGPSDKIIQYLQWMFL